jgi:hypothetical protein
VKADNFGDFEFDGPFSENCEYSLLIESEGNQPVRLTARTNIDVYLGELF